MSVFELLIFTCSTLSSLSGGYSKTCDWSSGGELFASVELCQTQADKKKGQTLFGDAVYMGSDGRISSGGIIEDVRCAERAVIDK